MELCTVLGPAQLKSPFITLNPSTIIYYRLLIRHALKYNFLTKPAMQDLQSGLGHESLNGFLNEGHFLPAVLSVLEVAFCKTETTPISLLG